jgi:glycosyltransferase WbpL
VLYELALAMAVAFVVAALVTSRVRAVALSGGLLDIPNARSSHAVPTPRGGGLAIVLTMTVALVAFAALRIVPFNTCVALLGGGTLVAAIGFLDDRIRLSPRTRLLAHFAAAVWGIAWLGGLPPLHLAGDQALWAGWPGYVLGALGIVWTLNLFNFMDGIDGIAAGEAVTVSWSGALLLLMMGATSAVPALSLVLGAACGGFLLWNWPPARIFMGDVGSGYLGYVIAILAIAASRESSVALVAWLILGGAFFVDATVTLLRRLARRERAHEAHRTHAYQWLARRWGSHRRVTILILAINVFWLLPCAVAASRQPRLAWWLLLLALAPLVVGALAAGAGRSERSAGP